MPGGCDRLADRFDMFDSARFPLPVDVEVPGLVAVPAPGIIAGDKNDPPVPDVVVVAEVGLMAFVVDKGVKTLAPAARQTSPQQSTRQPAPATIIKNR